MVLDVPISLVKVTSYESPIVDAKTGLTNRLLHIVAKKSPKTYSFHQAIKFV